jgi:hypothetical protein
VAGAGIRVARPRPAGHSGEIDYDIPDDPARRGTVAVRRTK